MKKKLVSIMMAATMIAGSLVGCGSQTDSTTANDSQTKDAAETSAKEETAATEDKAEDTSSDEPITLRMAWWGSQDRHDKTIAAIELYESLNPNVTIEYEYYSFDDYFTKLKTLVASDEVWDVFQLGGNFPMYIDKIYPLDEFIESGVVDVSKISEANLKTTRETDGTQLGLTNGINTYGIAYDPALFEEAGATLPTDDWTWEDYQKAADTITEKLGIFGSSTFLSSDFTAGCSTYIGQQGDLGQYSFFNLDLTGMGFDDPQMLAPFIQMRADMIKKGSYPDAGASAEVTNIENDFLVTGEAAMVWVAVNQFPTIYNACAEQGRELALAPLPKAVAGGNSGTLIQSSQMLCVSQDSEHKEAAAAFISWFENDVDCNNILQAERGIPANEDVREALSSSATKGQQIMYDYVDSVSKNPTPKEYNVLSPEGQDQVQDNYLNYIQQVASGEITAQEAAEKTYADAQAIFK
ncbi:multiple sugar transport system substrate-binding protein [Butyrivibrio hungatei DSM 14810]|uniref:Multiple sugar transport system substrate-binding protein n=1 Tax=Butyrivibrio hungatei DSM 14810 TaxID=1121132 RepID=A0A1M7RR16_9FIRM|nr:extracellular solute-binding protein [Butyrivibrio hungatei]SHN48546.1 multiple sugar transport system substrate-binding protein [Butyrivibrio hungatei DSM 14810]